MTASREIWEEIAESENETRNGEERVRRTAAELQWQREPSRKEKGVQRNAPQQTIILVTKRE